MRNALLSAFAALLLVVAAILQFVVAPRISVFGAAPEFTLIVAFCLSLLVRQSLGAVTGFVSALLTGALSGSTLTAYVFTRSLACFGLATASDLEPSPKSAAIAVAGTTLLTQIVLMFVAPTADLGEYVRVTFIQAILNGILAWPTYAGLQRLVRPKVV